MNKTVGKDLTGPDNNVFIFPESTKLNKSKQYINYHCTINRSF